MPDRKSRRVVIINNLKSETIDQAIFILKSEKSNPDKPCRDSSIIIEAQSIIDSYIRQVEQNKCISAFPGKSSKNSRSSRWSSLITVGATALFMLAVFFVIAYNM